MLSYLTGGSDNRDIEAQQNQNQGVFGRLSSTLGFGREEQVTFQDDGFFTGTFAMTTSQRIMGFLLSFFSGIGLIVISAFYVPSILFSSRTFAFFFTFGNFFLVVSTMFLLGPVRQVKMWFTRKRIFPTIFYAISTSAVIYCSIQQWSVVWMVVLLVIQTFSLIWYVLTYFTWFTAIIKKTLGFLSWFI